MISKNKYLIGSLIGLVIITATIIPIIIHFEFMDRNVLVDQKPIMIVDDSDFDNYNFPGKGTLSDPFRIEYYNITTEFITGILIRNTTKYFLIHNCQINAGETGILIENIAEGTARIEKNICINNDDYGIAIYNSSENIILNNTCSFSWYGIYIEEACYTTITENKCHNNIEGIYISQSANSTILHNICSNNTDSISLVKSDYSVLTGNICTKNLYGIIQYSNNSTLINNTCSNNAYGIYLYVSDRSTLTNNNCFNNSYGIMMETSSYCLITNNLLQENERHGIFMGNAPMGNCSSNNVIHHNSFNSNNLEGFFEIYLSQAYDKGFNNTWYDESTSEGNYWSDWDGSGAYSIDGLANSEDSYPLSAPPVMLNFLLMLDFLLKFA
jgi:parallel beta-helix repeat protein